MSINRVTADTAFIVTFGRTIQASAEMTIVVPKGRDPGVYLQDWIEVHKDSVAVPWSTDDTSVEVIHSKKTK